MTNSNWRRSSWSFVGHNGVLVDTKRYKLFWRLFLNFGHLTQTYMYVLLRQSAVTISQKMQKINMTWILTIHSNINCQSFLAPNYGRWLLFVSGIRPLGGCKVPRRTVISCFAGSYWRCETQTNYLPCLHLEHCWNKQRHRRKSNCV